MELISKYIEQNREKKKKKEISYLKSDGRLNVVWVLFFKGKKQCLLLRD